MRSLAEKGRARHDEVVDVDSDAGPVVMVTEKQIREMRKLRQRWPAIERHIERTYWKGLDARQRAIYWLGRTGRPLKRPLAMLKESWQTSGRYVSRLQREGGPGRSAQMRDHVMLWGRHGFMPEVYYDYGLHRSRYPAELYVDHHMMAYLQKYLVQMAYDGDHLVLEDKVAFYEHCLAHDLPTIPVLAVFRDGNVHWKGDAEDDHPQTDLFAKPLDLCQGAGALKWTYDGAVFRDREAEACGWGDIVDTLRRKSRRHTYLLQPCIRNHPAIENVCGAALADARIVTCRKPGGPAEHLAAFMRLPQKGSIASNLATGAVGASIGEEVGRLTRSLAKGEDDLYELCPRHPDTGAEVEGFQLPDWQDALQLALDAHDSVDRVAFVGWDVGFTAGGPVLIEGNHSFGAVGLQIISGRPLGATRFPLYYNLHFDSIHSSAPQGVQSVR